MSGNKSLTIQDTLTKGLLMLKGKYGEVNKKQLKKMAMQLLTWTSNGSPQCKVVPPIWWGILRGSGSVFVGSEMVMDSRSYGKDGTPNESLTESDENTITIGYNTAYAMKVHEGLPPEGTTLQLGPISAQSGDVEGKFLEKHLFLDAPALYKAFAEGWEEEAKKVLGL